MSHLLAISVGPVQEFIAAARKTRDLWFGSYLLSEISKAVAKSVKDQGGRLIFPHPDTDLDSGDDEINVANVILAELPSGEPKGVASQAKQAAQARWKRYAEETRQAASGAIRPKLPHEEKSIWDEQVDDVIEFYAAWVEGSSDYQKARGNVMRLLAGRKNCRDFLPAEGRAGVPKSSLDGQRETVLKDGDRTNWPKNLRLSAGEQLDVVGVTKRLGKEPGQSNPRYSSVTRIAAETWLQGVQSQQRDNFQRLKDACQRLIPKGLNTVPEKNYQYFPYEGSVIYKNRHTDLKKELRLGDPDLNEGDPDLNDVAAVLTDIGGEPNPYLAVLVADGDKMGAAISNLKSPDEHREFSQALAGFAGEARKIVNDHNGVLVYAGGDDVLAFLPLDNCLECARKLHDKFGELPAKNGSLTLSVGIAIGHFMENLEDLLDYGRAAEKAAKEPDRDGLAVHLHKRGGAPIRVRAKWTDNPSPEQRLTHYARLILAEAIPSKLPYDLRRLADLYDDWPANTVASALRQDVIRVVRDKQPRSGRHYMPQVERILEDVTDAASLHRFARELLVARQIAAALRQAGERPAPVVEAAS